MSNLSDYLTSGLMFGKKAKLLIDISLDNGESMEKGEVVSVLKDNGEGYYHVEHNDFACTVHESEIEFIK